MEKENLPINWPEGVSLPTREEAEKAVEEIEKHMEILVDDLRGKLKGVSGEMLNTVINI